MRKKIKVIAVLMAVVLLVLSTATISARYAPETASNDAIDASTKTARFFVMDQYDIPGVVFSMISECGELVIHINDEVPVFFEDYLYVSDDPADGRTRDARERLFDGETLAELLEGRRLVVTYAITTKSLPPQTTPLSVEILFETAVHLPADINDDNGNGYMGIVTLPAYINPFEDVNVDDWFFNAVVWAYQNGIMIGTGELFEPHTTVTRAMLVTILWRYAGEPAATAPVTFTDVAEGAWYEEAVAWAAENEIVTGFPNNIFAPGLDINREQLYTILYRYMIFAELTIELEEEMRLLQFADQELISDWAMDAMFFMFDAGIMFRYSSLDNYGRPQVDAPRAEIAAAMFFFDMFAY